MKLTNPQKQLINETDEQIRRLERAAAGGDEEAAEWLKHLKQKTTTVSQQVVEGITKTNESTIKLLNLIDDLNKDENQLGLDWPKQQQIYTPMFVKASLDNNLRGKLALDIQNAAILLVQVTHNTSLLELDQNQQLRTAATVEYLYNNFITSVNSWNKYIEGLCPYYNLEPSNLKLNIYPTLPTKLIKLLNTLKIPAINPKPT